MKSKLNIIILIATLATLAVGCATKTTVTPGPSGGWQTNTVSVVDTNSPWWGVLKSGLQIAASTGSRMEIQNDPNSKAYFLLAGKAIDDLLINQKLDADSLETALNSISVSEIRDSAALKELIADIATLYRNTVATVAAQKIDGSDGGLFILKQCLAGIRDGFAQTLKRLE